MAPRSLPHVTVIQASAVTLQTSPPKYSREQFLQIAVKVCPKLSEKTSLIIAEETWEQQGDIRDVISLFKLVKKHDGPGEIAEIIKMLAKYGDS